MLHAHAKGNLKGGPITAIKGPLANAITAAVETCQVFAKRVGHMFYKHRPVKRD